MGRTTANFTITPDILLRAYAIGLFPMAERAEDEHLFWLDPPERGIFPLNRLKISRSLAKTIRQERYRVSFDEDFSGVLDACAEPTPERGETWINAQIRQLYNELHQRGHAHSVEIWRGSELVGGLYGVSLGAAFFGESMFHRVTDASKIALVYLVACLRASGFVLLDTQFVTPHLASLGAIEIKREDYLSRLKRALERQAEFRPPVHRSSAQISGAEVLRLATAAADPDY